MFLNRENSSLILFFMFFEVSKCVICAVMFQFFVCIMLNHTKYFFSKPTVSIFNFNPNLTLHKNKIKIGYVDWLNFAWKYLKLQAHFQNPVQKK